MPEANTSPPQILFLSGPYILKMHNSNLIIIIVLLFMSVNVIVNINIDITRQHYVFDSESSLESNPQLKARVH